MKEGNVTSLPWDVVELMTGEFGKYEPPAALPAHRFRTGISPAVANRRPSRSIVKQVALYRHYDADGVLLYVGISNNPRGRSRTHRTTSVWTEFTVREEVQWLADRAEAEAAERVAIATEKPLFNGKHTTPDAQLACVEYLIKRGRTDLLRVGPPDA